MSSSQHRGKRQRRKVVWDEDNLAHLEETKTPKQKIDEPKTPYHTLSLDSDEANGLSPMQLPSSDTEANPGLNPEQVRSAITEVAQGRGRGGGGGWTSSEDEGDAEGFEKWMEERANGNGDGPSVSFQGSEEYYATRGEREGDVKGFKEHRRRHYDEYRRMKQLKVQKRDLETEEGKEEKMCTEEGRRERVTIGGVQGSGVEAGAGARLGATESEGDLRNGEKGEEGSRKATDGMSVNEGQSS